MSSLNEDKYMITNRKIILRMCAVVEALSDVLVKNGMTNKEELNARAKEYIAGSSLADRIKIVDDELAEIERIEKMTPTEILGEFLGRKFDGGEPT